MGRRKSYYIFAPEKAHRSSRGGWLIVLALAAGILAVTFFLNAASNNRVELLSEKVSVMGMDKAYEGFSVLHVSDLHAAKLGSDIELWRELLFGKTFHAVVFSGDMVGSDGDYEPMLSMIHTLRSIKQDVPIYFIAGDDDPPAVNAVPSGTPEALADWVRAAQKQGAIYLDAPVAQQVGKGVVWFTPEYLYDVDAAGMAASLQVQKAEMEEQGLPYQSEGGAAYRALCYRLEAMQRTVEAQKMMESSHLQIAVNHAPLDPAYIRTGLEWADQTRPFNFRQIDLVLCGHICGGQWRLPGNGPVYVPERGWFPGDDGLVGLDRINSINQYVSPGLGASEAYPMPGRLFNTPCATILKFTASLQ